MPLTEEEVHRLLDDSDDSDWDGVQEVDAADFFTSQQLHKKGAAAGKKSTSNAANNKQGEDKSLKDIGFETLMRKANLESCRPSTEEKGPDEEIRQMKKENRPSLSHFGQAVHDQLKEQADKDKLQRSYSSSASWKKPNAMPSSSSSVLSSSSAYMGDTEGYFVAIPTRVRVVEPRMTQDVWKSRTTSRNCVTLSQLSARRQRLLQSRKALCGSSSEGSSGGSFTLVDTDDEDWYTVAVIVARVQLTKKDRGGQPYTIWEMSDLQGVEMERMRLMLFRNVHETWWKESEGAVFAVLKPKFVAPKEGHDDPTVVLTVDKAEQILLLGRSPDFGICQGITKAGQKCTKVVNKQRSPYCDFHVKKAYTKALLHRPGFKATGHGIFQQQPPKTLHARSASFGGVGGAGCTPGMAGAGPLVVREGFGLGLVGSRRSSAVLQMDQEEEDRQANLGSKVWGSRVKDAASIDSLEDSLKFSYGAKALKKHFEEFNTAKNPEPAAKRPKPAEPLTQSSAAPKAEPLRTFADLKKRHQMEEAASKAKQHEMTMTKGKLDASQSRAVAVIRAQGGLAAMQHREKEGRQQRISENLDKAWQKIQAKQKQASGSGSTLSKYEKSFGMSQADVERMLKATSSHKDLVQKAEIVEEKQMLDKLEEREKLEEHLTSVHEQKVKIFFCKKCKVKTLKAPVRCKEDGHPVVRTDGARRFFKCCDCGQRTCTLDRYPEVACKKCHGKRFEKTGMMRERSGPSLPSEVLHIRALDSVDDVAFQDCE